MDITGWKIDPATEDLRNQISDYVKEMIDKDLPRISFRGYLDFIHSGSRKESEDAYFYVRKQLTALGLYLQWNEPSQKEKEYFNELLWSVSNEFSWCLAAHLNYGDDCFAGDSHKQIDLFAAETAQTLSEILILHSNLIDPFLQSHIRKQITERVINSFLERQWNWEVSPNNWCAVCSGSIGITALLLESGERKKRILDKVDTALVYYLDSFGEAGATEEGIGYWGYGFGYFIYYIAKRRELDPNYQLSERMIEKIRRIGEFPSTVQIAENLFVPFSDAEHETIIPTGLISYLYHEFGVTPPFCTRITSFDFEHCYRFAHISRNLWWTDKNIFYSSLKNMRKLYDEKQWLLYREEPCFLAVKGGNNCEEHNHNDVGSFILALDGEFYLTDLGAGPYTKDYFGEKRYQHPHTRSYWHNLPVIEQTEQTQTKQSSIFEVAEADTENTKISMELSMFYPLPALQTFKRTMITDSKGRRMRLTDHLQAYSKISFEEGLVSKIKPEVEKEGIIRWKGNRGCLTLTYDPSILNYKIESQMVSNHRNQLEEVHRLALSLKNSADHIVVPLEFSY